MAAALLLRRSPALAGAQCRSMFSESQGPPGRSALSGVNVIVFGATGFVGRYVVGRLGRIGSRVVVPFRGDQHAWRHLKVMGDVGQVVPIAYDPKENWATLGKAFENAHVVINLVGRDYETRNFSFEDVHVKLAEKIAKTSAEAGVDRLIHLSALGADAKSPSSFMRSKAAGEEAVRAAYPEATILRPADIFGPEDRFINTYAFRSKVLPIVPLAPGVAQAKKQPVHISDVATAVMNVIRDPTTVNQVIQAAGPEVLTMRAFLDRLYAGLDRSNTAYTVPGGIINKIASILEKAPSVPPMTQDSLVRDALDIVQTSDSPSLASLGINPSPMDGVLLNALLRQYRKPKHFSDAHERDEANLVPQSKTLS